MSNRLLKILSLSLVTMVLLAQVVDRQHLHINDTVDSVCEVCAHSDANEALLGSTFEFHTQTNVVVEFDAAVSAALATKRWALQSRAPPHSLA